MPPASKLDYAQEEFGDAVIVSLSTLVIYIIVTKVLLGRGGVTSAKQGIILAVILVVSSAIMGVAFRNGWVPSRIMT